MHDIHFTHKNAFRRVKKCFCTFRNFFKIFNIFYFEFFFQWNWFEPGSFGQELPIFGSRGPRRRPHPGHDAPVVGGVLHRAPGPRRVHLLGPKQPPEVLGAHAQMVQRASPNVKWQKNHGLWKRKLDWSQKMPNFGLVIWLAWKRKWE